MYPTLFEFQGLGFHTWGLMVMLAFLAAALVAHPRAAKVGIDPDKLVPLYLLSVFLGLAGARLLHFVFAEPKLFFSHPLAFFDFGQGGFAFYGGVILGVIGGAIYCRVRGIPVLKMADIASLGIMVGLAVGRIGCFSAGCCHGATCHLPAKATMLNLPGGSIVTTDGFPWVALVFTRGVGVGAIHDVPVYPTQVWAFLGALTLFFALAWMWNHVRRFDGQIMASMLVLYAIDRSTIEAFRGDTVRGLYDFGAVQLSTSQIVSISMVVVAIVLVAIGLPRGLGPEEPFVAPEIDDLPDSET